MFGLETREGWNILFGFWPGGREVEVNGKQNNSAGREDQTPLFQDEKYSERVWFWSEIFL